MKAYFDTAVLVAASVADHPHHGQALALLSAARTKRVEAYISGHGLAEFYAVLTRTPFTPPIYPSEAWQLLAENILPCFEIVALSAKEYEETIHRCAQKGWTGGRVYDALHIYSAQKAACAKIYTLTVRHFRQLAPELADRIFTP